MDPLASTVAGKFLSRVGSRYAYHGTRADLLSFIARHGLVAGSSASSYSDAYSEYDDGHHVFFSDDENYIRAYYGDTILRFPWPSDATQDKNKYGRYLENQFVSKHNVPANRIEVLQADGAWVALKTLGV